jgi:hypothetical protein
MKIDDLYALNDTNSWRSVNAFLRQRMDKNPSDVEIVLTKLYFLIDLLLEGPVRGQIDFVAEADEIAQEIRNLYFSSVWRFNNHPEYLFFAGYFLGLVYYFFPGDEVEKAKTEARYMNEKATKLEPGNLLYEWGAKRPSSNLQKQVLANDKIVDWLNSRWDYGEYMMGVLKTDISSLTTS